MHLFGLNIAKQIWKMVSGDKEDTPLTVPKRAREAIGKAAATASLPPVFKARCQVSSYIRTGVICN